MKESDKGELDSIVADTESDFTFKRGVHEKNGK